MKKVPNRLFLPMIYFLLIFLFIFLLKEFEIKKLILISSGKDIKGLNVFNRRNLLFLDTEKISKMLLEQNKDIRTVKITKKFPHSIIIIPTARIPKALIIYKNLNYLIDEDGILLPKDNKSTTELPIIETVIAPYSSNNITDWRINKALSYLAYGLKSGIIIEKIIIDNQNDDYFISTKDGEKVIVPQINDSGYVIASLQIIISRFRIEGKFIKSIDYRVEKPIVLLKDEGKISSQ